MPKPRISLQECKQIISKAVNIEVNEIDIRYELSVIENSFGYIADLARLTISIGQENDEKIKEKLAFFVKLVPLDNNGDIRRSDLNWMFEREAFMYSEILMKMNGKMWEWEGFSISVHCQINFKLKKRLPLTGKAQWRPQCYLVRADLLVLEDLNLSGFKHLEHRTRFDRPLVECVLRYVAKIHADSVAYETRIHPKNLFDAFGDYKEEFGVTPDKKWFQRGIEAIKAIIPLTPSYKKYAEKYSSKRFDELVSPIYDMVKPSSKYRNVFCHQDIWAGNIMFKFAQNNGKDNPSEPVSCVLMDYQFPRYVPPATDVLMFVLFTTRLDNRRKYLSTYLRYYYDCLCTELKNHGLNADDVLSWNDFRASCNDLKLFPMVYNCVGLPFTYFPNEIQMKIRSNEAEEFRMVREVNHHDYIIKYMKQDEEFKDVVLESIEELMETMFE